MAVHPNSGIQYGSKIYVETIGWFIVEDICSKKLKNPTFDMWTGRENKALMCALTGPKGVSIFGPKETVPENYQRKEPGPLWNFMPAGTSRVGEKCR